MSKDLFVIEGVRVQSAGADIWFCLGDVLEGLGDKQTANHKVEQINKWFEDSPLYTEVGGPVQIGVTDSVNLGLTAIYKSTKIQVPDALNRMQPTTFINEPLLYWVLNRSNSPKAMIFTAKVHSIILPQIRTTGGYTVDAGLTAEQKYRIECEEKAKAPYLALQMLYQDPAQRAVATGKYVRNEFGDAIPIPQIAAPEQVRTLNPTELGQLFEPAINPRRINTILQEVGFQYKDHNHSWVLTDSGKRYGVLTVVDKQYNSKVTKSPQQGTVYQVRWLPCTYDAIIEYLQVNNE